MKIFGNVKHLQTKLKSEESVDATVELFIGKKGAKKVCIYEIDGREKNIQLDESFKDKSLRDLKDHISEQAKKVMHVHRVDNATKEAQYRLKLLGVN